VDAGTSLGVLFVSVANLIWLASYYNLLLKSDATVIFQVDAGTSLVAQCGQFYVVGVVNTLVDVFSGDYAMVLSMASI